MDFTDLIMRLLALLFMALSGSGDSAGSPGETGDTIRQYHTIDNVEVRVLESFPMQLQLHVTGSKPTGCEGLTDHVEQTRDGSTVTVEIFQKITPAMVCPMILLPYEATIMLEGTFEPGTYTINVNDFTTTVEL